MPTRPPRLQQWSALHYRSTLFATTRGRLAPLTSPDCPPRMSHCQSFHTTSSYNAARRPARAPQKTRMRAAQGTESGFSANILLQDLPHSIPAAVHDVTADLQNLEKNGFRLASELLYDGVIDKSVTPTKFKRIGKAFLEHLAHSRGQFSGFISRLAQTEGVAVDTIFDMITLIAPERKLLTLSAISCALAGSRKATFLMASTYLRSNHDGKYLWNHDPIQEPYLTHTVALVQKLATTNKSNTGEQDDRDPRAMLLYAKYLGLRGNYTQALDLVKELMGMIGPRTQLDRMKDLTLAGRCEPPWELYLWLRRALKEESDPKHVADINKSVSDDSGHNRQDMRPCLEPDEIEALRLGAEVYQHPYSLMCYAVVKGWTDGIHEFERYMGQAAAAGSSDACLRLANFYWLIARGHYPKPVARSESGSAKLQGYSEEPDRYELNLTLRNEASFLGKLLSYFRPRSILDYRALAMEWSRVAWEMGNLSAGLNLVVLNIEDGNFEVAERLLDAVDAVAEKRGDAELWSRNTTFLRANFRSGRAQRAARFLNPEIGLIPGWP
ncbi:hypothetical protein BJY04DRAFT_213099 [Aspergillus karnatakaensis]|uniref:uncharacterized protein n=1 Tax=Aspergillus karnatakaensis TaxID=1810916 RepID=UPI003CCD9CBF